MNVKLFLLCFVAVASAAAADGPTTTMQLNTTLYPPPQSSDSLHAPIVITPKKDMPVIQMGRSDFVFSGPLVQGFRRLPPQEGLSRGQRFLRLPVIRLFVPQPMPNPPETGKYFAWRNEECSLSWPEAASRPAILKGPY